MVGEKCFRKKQKRVDCLLRFRRDFIIAIVEAKSAYKNSAGELQQAKEYAEILGLKFAYSTNGKGIVEHDFIAVKDVDPEVTEKAVRRKFTAKYKLRILQEAEVCATQGQMGALLRREGLCSSNLTTWRRQRKQGAEYTKSELLLLPKVQK